ncbi:response regulator transcription factor [Spirosoma sp. KCTC 42546]|uniref:LytR/AlgR family response regulator transcription factor n=1 Tax=Spirosoma sp. KCTC 42546 TaxID=2520506 RepID=UPI0011597EC9|nr:LytTR family DNA-binding domain-containing protein [Spirosoma sp. KCTC 42546]QDK82106.1 response regulator transcription factor [Spirosoma sp. KCTC 42546]
MNVVLIEDEDRTARQLERLLKKYDPTIHILAQLPSVSETVAWFRSNPLPDLAFMDIHLEDGLVFKVFEQQQLTLPIIFTTAYDEYMLKAFKVNSIDYLLKPVDYDELAAALDKFKSIRNQPATPDLSTILQLLQKPQTASYRERFMISLGTKIHSVEVADIAYFYTEEKATFLVNRVGQFMPLEYSLDQLMGLLNPANFFRVNRQFLVARSAIQAIHTYSAGKLKLNLLPTPREEIFVSLSRLSEFKDWLGR